MKKNSKIILNIAALVLVLVFIVKTVIDYGIYLKSFTSAPFRVWIMMNALYFLIPALILFLIGLRFH